MDCGFEQATWSVRSVKLFAFAGEVGPHGGGTMLLPGTHRLVARYRESLPGPAPVSRTGGPSCVTTHGWLASSTVPACQTHGQPLAGTVGEIDGVPVQVIELTRSPGDVVITPPVRLPRPLTQHRHRSAADARQGDPQGQPDLNKRDSRVPAEPPFGTPAS
jgi:hypothetical protein